MQMAIHSLHSLFIPANPLSSTSSMIRFQKLLFLGTSKSGFMTAQLFKDWFTKQFLQYCSSTEHTILILDGHSSHVELSVLELAREKNVSIMALPPHTSHLFQPLDVGIFGPMKSYFKQLMTTHFAKHNMDEPTLQQYVEMLV